MPATDFESSEARNRQVIQCQIVVVNGERLGVLETDKAIKSNSHQKSVVSVEL